MKQKQLLGFGIVGCGLIAPFHARALAEIPQARLVAVQSRSRAKAEALAAQFPGTAVCSRLEELLGLPEVDVVCVCTPSGNHLEPALAAAQAGKHVVVEKPLEVTLDRCDRLIAGCAAAGVQLCTIFPSRYGDANLELKKAVTAGRFGRLTLVETACKWWRSQAYYDEGGWKGTLALDGGGALMNQAIHNVDLLLWLAGPATKVAGFTATLAHQRMEVEDTAAAVLTLANGALGVIQAATSVHPGWPKTIALHGDRGSAVIEQDDILKWDFDPLLPEDELIKERFAQKVGASGGASNPAAISHEGHRRQLAEFVEAVLRNRPPAVDGREGRRAVELILRIYESARTGNVITLAS